VFRSRPVSLALVGLFVWVSACTTYTQIGLNEVADHEKIRVTTSDGERDIIRDPRVDGDSIKGHLQQERRVIINPLWSMPVDHVAELEAVGTSASGLKVVAIVVGAALVILLIVTAICVETGEDLSC